MEDLNAAREKCLSNIIDDLAIDKLHCTAVDLGIGSGVLALQLLNKYPKLKIIGIDKDISYLKGQLDSLGISRIALLEEDILHTSLKNDSADMVFFYNMVRHLPRADLRPALSEAGRVLSENGKLYILDTCPQPSTKAQSMQWDVYCLENEIEELLGNVPETYHQPDEIRSELYQVSCLIDQEAIYDEDTISFPAEVWENKKKELEELCKKVSSSKREVISQRIGKLDKQIRVLGIESLPIYLIIARQCSTPHWAC